MDTSCLVLDKRKFCLLFTTQCQWIKFLTRHAYARAVQGHLLTQLALGRMILKNIEFSAEEHMEIKDLLEKFDNGTGEQRMEDQIYKFISEKVESQLQMLKDNVPTAALWIQYEW